jgi:hypothetical protein
LCASARVGSNAFCAHEKNEKRWRSMLKIPLPAFTIAEKLKIKNGSRRPQYFIYKYAQRSNIIVEFPRKEVDFHGEEEGKEEEISPHTR